MTKAHSKGHIGEFPLLLAKAVTTVWWQSCRWSSCCVKLSLWQLSGAWVSNTGQYWVVTLHTTTLSQSVTPNLCESESGAESVPVEVVGDVPVEAVENVPVEVVEIVPVEVVEDVPVKVEQVAAAVEKERRNYQDTQEESDKEK